MNYKPEKQEKMVHRFACDVSGVELPARFTNPFHYEPHRLALIASHEVMSYVASRQDWHEEVSRGKMLGVLVVSDASGELGYLAAFSGNLAGSNSHEFFVPPVYDMLRPDGEFRSEEEAISHLNRQVEYIKSSNDYKTLHCELEAVRRKADDAVAAHKELMMRRKAERDAAREACEADEATLIRESQWLKAELRRIKARGKAAIADVEAKVKILDDRVEQLCEERRRRSVALQKWLFHKFVMLNARGESRTLTEIFADTPQGLPPAGAGECAAPKLLQYAYAHSLRPVAMAEFWYGASPTGEIRRHGHFYEACRSKCLPILGFMLQGLDVEQTPDCALPEQVRIIYEDAHIVAADKPSGMLTVPGKISATSLHELLQRQIGHELLVVHRLDMDTSGVVIFAKDKATHKALQRQFAGHTARKEYVALLGGAVPESSGVIDLPLCADVEHRPQQMISHEHGKHALTHYAVTPLPAAELAMLRAQGIEGDVTRVRFTPLTGRTHQLRVHAAHTCGLNAPILGDRLYGRATGGRLWLHAEVAEVVHPATGAVLRLVSECTF